MVGRTHKESTNAQPACAGTGWASRSSTCNTTCYIWKLRSEICASSNSLIIRGFFVAFSNWSRFCLRNCHITDFGFQFTLAASELLEPSVVEPASQATSHVT